MTQEEISKIKKDFENEINEAFQKYNKMAEGEAIFLIGLRNMETGLYRVDGFHSELGRTFKHLYVGWHHEPLCLYRDHSHAPKTE